MLQKNMLMKKKQMLKENLKDDGHRLDDGLNLNQPLTDQLVKHRNSANEYYRGWNDGSYAGVTNGDVRNGHGESFKEHSAERPESSPKVDFATLPQTVLQFSESQNPTHRSTDRSEVRVQSRSSKDSSDNNSHELSTDRNGSSSSNKANTKINKEHQKFKNKDRGERAGSNRGKQNRTGEELKETAGSTTFKSVDRDPWKDFLPSVTSGNSNQVERIIGLQGYPYNGIPLQRSSVGLDPSFSHQLLQQQQQATAAAAQQQLRLLHQARPPSMSTPALLSSYTLHDTLVTRQLEMLWQQKYPTRSIPPVWMLFQYQEELLRDPGLLALQQSREKDGNRGERERAAEKDRLDREKLEKGQKSKAISWDNREWEKPKPESFERPDSNRRNAGQRAAWEWDNRSKDVSSGVRDFPQNLAQQRRELIVEGSSASDAVNQHFEESLQRMKSQKTLDVAPMEIARPSFAFTNSGNDINTDKVKIERQHNPLCASMTPPDGAGISLITSQSRRVDSPAGVKHVKPEQFNLDLYGYRSYSDRIFITPDRLQEHGLKEEKLVKSELDGTQYPQDNYMPVRGSMGYDMKHEMKHETKYQTSVIMEPQHARNLSSDVHDRGSITLGTSGSVTQRASEKMPRNISGSFSNNIPNNLAPVSLRQRSAASPSYPGNTVGDSRPSPSYLGNVGDAKPSSHSRLVAGSPCTLAIDSSVSNSCLDTRQWQANIEPIERWGMENSWAMEKMRMESRGGIPKAGYPVTSYNLVQQGLVPNPIYMPSRSSPASCPQYQKSSNAGESSSKSGRNGEPGSSSKKRFKRDASVERKRTKTDSLDKAMEQNSWPVQSAVSSSVQERSQIDDMMRSAVSAQQPAYMDSFKSFVDQAVQKAFQQEQEMETSKDNVRKHRTDLDQILHNYRETSSSATSRPASREHASVHQWMLEQVQTQHSASASQEVAEMVSSVTKEQATAPCPVSQDVVCDKPIPTDVPESTSSTSPTLLSIASTIVSTTQMFAVPQRPLSVVSPGSLSSLSSVAENINRERPPGIDTDSDTLSVHSPVASAATTQCQSNDSGILLSSNTSGHPKFKKAWLMRYSDEDKKSDVADKISTPSSSETSAIGKIVENGSSAVRDCYINLSKEDVVDSSLPSSGAQQLTEEAVGIKEDLSAAHSSDDSRSNGSQCSGKQTRSKKSTKRQKTSEPENSPTMPDLVPENQIPIESNASSKDNMDVQSSPNSKEAVYDFCSLMSQSHCETKLADRCQQKSKKNPSAVLESKPLNQLSHAKRKKLKMCFLQDAACSDLTPKLLKCRECKLTRTQRSKNMPNIFCRFYAFRKLQYNTKGFLAVTGFSEPTDADADDIELWMPMSSVTSQSLNADQAKYILANLKDCFRDLMERENKALLLCQPNGKIAWKRPIQGVREMCDACDATLFDVHWVCPKCGFAVCSDCYSSRSSSEGTAKECNWLTCSANRQEHEFESLIMTQIIPSDVRKVVNRIHFEVLDKLKEDKTLKRVNGLHRQKPGSNPKLSNGTKATSVDSPEKRRQARKRTHAAALEKKAKSGSPVENLSENDSTVDADNCNGINSEKDEENLNKTSPSKPVVDEGKDHGSPEIIPRIDGDPDREDLLELVDPNNADNLGRFQARWQKSLPVVFSNCDSQIDCTLWSPDNFAIEFGHLKVDLVDCVNGSILKSQLMEKFWENFVATSTSKGRSSSNSGSSILRIKDWILPDGMNSSLQSDRMRSTELKQTLPLCDYTHHTGIFNLVSHLPDFFVKPDVLTTLHAGYGSSHIKGAHYSGMTLKSLDFVNLMVHVAAGTIEGENQTSGTVEKALRDASYENVDTKSKKPIGAVWHIFKPEDADKIQEFIKKAVLSERHGDSNGASDSCLSGSSYLDKKLRSQLSSEFGVQCCVVVQRLGDAICIPAMSPHQVKNLNSCISVGRDFLSPESVRVGFHRIQEDRKLRKSDGCNSAQDDHIQNVIYHATKECLAVLRENNASS